MRPNSIGLPKVLVPDNYRDGSAARSGQTTIVTRLQHICYQDGIETKRRAILSNLQEIRDHFQLLRNKNWSTHDAESVFDHTLMPLIARAEHKHNPANHMTYEVNAFERIQEFSATPRLTLITNIPDQQHFVAMDIRNKGGKLSVVILDSIHAGFYDDSDLRKMTANMPPDSKTSIICLETQNASHGCRIFAFSITSKIAKSAQYIEALHDAHLNPQHSAFTQFTQARQVCSSSGVHVYTYPGSIPASFLKHSHSQKRLSLHYPGHRHQVINKQGQTLVNRQQDKLIHRKKLKAFDNGFWYPVHLIFSASIEDKRIQYLERCIDYMREAGNEVVEEMTDIFNTLKELSTMPSQIGLQLDQRTSGPADAMQKRANYFNYEILSLNNSSDDD